MTLLRANKRSSGVSRTNSLSDAVSTSRWSGSRGHRRQRGVRSNVGQSTMKRLQRVESHVVTLARSLSYMSSELSKLRLLESGYDQLSTELDHLRGPAIDLQPQDCHSSSNHVKNAFSNAKPLTDGAIRLSKLTR